MPTEERTKEILKALHEAVVRFEEEDTAKWARIAVEEGVDPFVAAMEGLAAGGRYMQPSVCATSS